MLHIKLKSSTKYVPDMIAQRRVDILSRIIVPGYRNSLQLSLAPNFYCSRNGAVLVDDKLAKLWQERRVYMDIFLKIYIWRGGF